MSEPRAAQAPSFLVETYLAPGTAGDPAAALSSFATVAAAQAGVSAARHLMSVLVPAEETCLHLFQADGEDAVRALAQRAGLGPVRVVPCHLRGAQLSDHPANPKGTQTCPEASEQ
ncbi:MAG: hypothetical protein U0R70_12590 [Solirubrobacteraceae bacterium]